MACCFKIGQSSEILDIFNGCLKNNVDNTTQDIDFIAFFYVRKMFQKRTSL